MADFESSRGPLPKGPEQNNIPMGLRDEPSRHAKKQEIIVKYSGPLPSSNEELKPVESTPNSPKDKFLQLMWPDSIIQSRDFNPEDLYKILRTWFWQIL